MSWEMLGRVIKSSKADNGSLLVMIALANYANDDDQAWPAVATIEKISRLSERQVRANLRKLEELGEIRPAGKGPKGTVRYHLTPGQQETSGAVSAPQEGQFPQGGGAVTAPEPREEPLDGQPLESPAPSAAGEHKLFMDSWHDAFQMQFGRDYIFAGGKDGMAVKRLLTASKKTAADLMKIVTRAWSRKGKQFWNCEKAISISGFCSRFNEILAELHRPMPGDVVQHSAPKITGKKKSHDRPLIGDEDPDTGKPLTREEIETKYPIADYE